MQNYNQQPQGYQRPGSTTSFAGQPGVTSQYHAQPPQQNFQSPPPAVQSQWAPPAQNTAAGQQQWTQSPQQNWGTSPPSQQQTVSGYNPGTYGAMPGAYSQPQAPPVPAYQQDNPPPPPPKPQGFAAAVQQQQQNQQQPQGVQSWSQQSGLGMSQTAQNFQASPQSTGFTPQGQQSGFNLQGQQGGFQQSQQNSFQNQPTQQQPYDSAAPPPASATPGGSYFPPSQARPTSIYGADQTTQFSSPTSTQPPNTVMSPNEQQPVYIPPSLSGQGVQSYMPPNTNPMPGVYVPPPPDIPAWQQAQHAPLQPGKSKFKYTRPNPNFQHQPPQMLQGVAQQQPMQQQAIYPMQQQLQQPQQPLQPQMQQQAPFNQNQQPIQQHPHSFTQSPPNQIQQSTQTQGQGQFGQQTQVTQLPQPEQQQFGQPVLQQAQFQPQQQAQPQQFAQPAHGHYPSQQPVQQLQRQDTSGQWTTSPPAQQGYGQAQQNPSGPYGTQQPISQQGWQAGQPTPGQIGGQSYLSGQDIQAPKPVGHSQTTPPSFVNAPEPSPQNHPVSPVSERQSVSYGSGQDQSTLGRNNSVSSIALGALGRRQTLTDRTGSVPPKAPSPPPLDAAASALGAGGPSDWEHFGAIDEEIDDEELFGAKKEEKSAEPPMLDSVELPVHPSPPSSVHEWPSPPVPAAANLNVSPQRQDTFIPTPPMNPATVTTDTSSQSNPVQQFVMDDSIVVSHSPQPVQSSQPPPAQQTFVMHSGGWSQSSNLPEVKPITTDNASKGFVMDDGGWGAAQQTPTQRSSGGIALPSNSIGGQKGWEDVYHQLEKEKELTAELQSKLESQQRLVDLEKEKGRLREEEVSREKDDLMGEIRRAKAEADEARVRAETDARNLNQQLEQLKTDLANLKKESGAKDASLKEQNITIELLKEDIESKEKTLEDQGLTINDLRKQLREVPAPTPAALIPDLDPWYAMSLERYITMLRQEAIEPVVESKVKVFTAFLAAESHARGLEYPAPPPRAPVSGSPAIRPQSVLEQDSGISRVSSTKSFRKQDIHVAVPIPSAPVEEGEYSPGGRPVMRRKPTLKSNDNIPTEHSFGISTGLDGSRPTSVDNVPPRSGSTTSFTVRGSFGGIGGDASAQSTTILTPTSSTGDDFHKTIQSAPEPPAEAPQQQYQPYVPGRSDHRQSMSFGTASFQPGKSNKHDEIFFGEVQSQSTSKPDSRPTTSTSTLPDVPIPAPLSFQSSQSGTKKSEPSLASLLPTDIVSRGVHPIFEEFRARIPCTKSDFGWINDFTKNWEKIAAETRAKNERARRQRQSEVEEESSRLFDEHVISYVEIGDREAASNAKEEEIKAKEGRDEYKSYVEMVFDPVYDRLQEEIKELMEGFADIELEILPRALNGKRALENADPSLPTTLEALQLLHETHDLIELRQEKVAQAVAERDKRYKKTEIQPLYAAGNFAKMKSMEKHFENAEKQASLRAKGEKAERVGNLVRISEEAVVQAVGIEKALSDQILAAMKTFTAPDEDAQNDVLLKAKETFLALKASSKALLTFFNTVEIELNSSVLEAEIAQAKAEGADEARIKELEKEMRDGEKKLRDELEKRVGLLEKDKGVVEGVLEERGVVEGDREEEERERRLKAALEEAKRRNGEV